MVDVSARVLNIAAQLAPLIRAHAAAIAFARPAHVALRLGLGSAALRFGPRALLDLGQKPQAEFTIERICHSRVRARNCDQAQAHGKNRLHASHLARTPAAGAITQRAIAAFAESTARSVKSTASHRSIERRCRFITL
jgi:hypothetical protein